MNRIKENIKNPFDLLMSLTFRFRKHVPDKLYLKVMFRSVMGYWPDLKHPKTFNEKLQWLKLYDRRPEYTTMVDKYAVKKYVADKIGEQYIIPTLGVWDKPEDIEWEKLPNQFVLKCTHDSGGLVICRDKSKLDKEAAKDKLRKSLLTDYYLNGREWPYKNVPRRIIAEKYIEPKPDLKDLPDYKFFCFDGEVKALFVATDRQKPGEDVKFDFFDAEFNHLPFKQGHEHAATTPKKPKNFEVMKKVAAQLSKGMPHARVDLYEVGDSVLFGEVTLFHFSGLVPFRPDNWDKIFGDMLTLPGELLGGAIYKIKDNGDFEVSQPDLPDYKWYCFSGEPMFCQVILDRSSRETIDFFDTKWNHQDFIGFNPKAVNAESMPPKPCNLEHQIEIAKVLSENMPYSRIDLYSIGGRLYFGEITLYPMSGMGQIRPRKYDAILGQMITLPDRKIV